MNAVEVNHLVKRYGDLVAVDDLSFTVKQGEILGLIGPKWGREKFYDQNPA